MDLVEVTGTADAVEPRYTARQVGQWSETAVADTAARVAYWALPWWRRWREPRPTEWQGSRC
jgi:hypothetical protein